MKLSNYYNMHPLKDKLFLNQTSLYQTDIQLRKRVATIVYRMEPLDDKELAKF